MDDRLPFGGVGAKAPTEEKEGGKVGSYAFSAHH